MTRKTTDTFRIDSAKEAADFAVSIGRYAESPSASCGIRTTVGSIYEYAATQSFDDRTYSKLLNAYVDLELTYIFMKKDVSSAGGTHNRLNDAGRIDGRSVLRDFALFSGKMDILYSLSAFSFRVRAFWDKYMGILLLIYDREKYEKFIRARSRRTFFIRRAHEWPHISIHLRRCLTAIVKEWYIRSGHRGVEIEFREGEKDVPFPDPFLELIGKIVELVDVVRTPEAHGTGSLWKWTLANLPPDRSGDFGLVNHWNYCNQFMQALRKVIAELPRSSAPFYSMSNVANRGGSPRPDSSRDRPAVTTESSSSRVRKPVASAPRESRSTTGGCLAPQVSVRDGFPTPQGG